jgi:hypothetical protein
MNERIQELSKQAGLKIEYLMISPPKPLQILGSAEQFEKFAELIIRECAELTLDYKNDNYYNGWLDYRDEIKRHFGVEE